jgi:hypothetical protein
MGEIALARARALDAARNACGDSVESRFYAKLIVDRYELVMREHGFEYLPALPIALTVAPEEKAAQPVSAPVESGSFAAVFARFYRSAK